MSNKESIDINELIVSLKACVSGDSCEKCMECENIKTRFCWVKLMEKSVSVLEQMRDKDKFNLFVWNTLGRNEMCRILDLYRESDHD